MFLHGHSIISETIGETQGKTAHQTGKDALQCEGPLPGEGTKKTNGTPEKQEKTLSSLVSTRNLQDVPSSTSSYALSREPETSSDDHIGGVIDLRFKATPISNESEVSGTNGDTFWETKNWWLAGDYGIFNFVPKKNTKSQLCCMMISVPKKLKIYYSEWFRWICMLQA